MSAGNDNLRIVFAGWVDGLRRGDLDAIEQHLHPGVVWQGVRPDLSCADRAEVLDTLRATGGRLPDVSGVSLHAEGDQVLFSVTSPDLVEVAGAELDEQIHQLFTVTDGLIVRIDEFRARADAVALMEARRSAPAALGVAPPAPVHDLIPFVHVADPARSIAFYERLGFAAEHTVGPGDRLDWAFLVSGEARLMVARAGERVVPEQQAVLFYLYTRDLAGLQAHLRAHGHRAGQIRDGSPGPKQEMRVVDPDGYVLMVAQRAD